MRYFFSVVVTLVFCLTGCNDQTYPTVNSTLEKDSLSTYTTAKTEKELLMDSLKALEIDDLWLYLVIHKGGCLGPGERYVKADRSIHSEICVFRRRHDYWDLFFNKPSRELADFLLSEFADTTMTKVHICSYDEATSGELAVYSE